jgi:hypothetical protein
VLTASVLRASLEGVDELTGSSKDAYAAVALKTSQLFAPTRVSIDRRGDKITGDDAMAPDKVGAKTDDVPNPTPAPRVQ